MSTVRADKLDRIRALAAEGRSAGEIADALECAPETVQRAARGAGIVLGGSRAAVAATGDRIRDLAAQGKPARDIAETLRLTERGVRSYAGRHGIALPHMTPEERLRAQPCAGRAGGARTPAWVPADLTEDYRDLAADLGPAYAAAAIRRLMEDAR